MLSGGGGAAGLRLACGGNGPRGTKVAEERLELQLEQETGKKRERPVRPWKDAVSRRLRCECF